MDRRLVRLKMSDPSRTIATDCNDAERAMTPRRAVLVLIAAVVLAGAALPLDPIVSAQTSKLGLGGDLKREMEYLQQFGAITSCVLIALAILLLDPRGAARLPRAVLALGGNALTVFVLKSLVGRPRPGLNDPYHFGGPLTAYTLTRTQRENGVEQQVQVVRHAWEFWKSGTSDLWSLPSNHTAAAFALAAVLSYLYPRVRPLVLCIAVGVGVCRVMFDAHYVSDVIMGAGLGYVTASLIMSWGGRGARGFSAPG